MATSDQPHPSPGAPGRRGRKDEAGGGPAWTPGLPRPDWWVDGAEAMGRDWPRIQGSAWDAGPGPAGGRRRARARRREPALRLPLAALAAARDAGSWGRPADPEAGPGRAPEDRGGAASGWRRALAGPCRALAGPCRALVALVRTLAGWFRIPGRRS